MGRFRRKLRDILADPPIHPRPDSEFELGLIQALAHRRQVVTRLGMHDPDGHLIVIGEIRPHRNRFGGNEKQGETLMIHSQDQRDAFM